MSQKKLRDLSLLGEMGEKPQGGLDESATDIFKSLFGEAKEENAVACSIFSDSNPFRRKPNEQLSENGNDGNPEIFSLGRRNKRKRDEENALNLNSFSAEAKWSEGKRGEKRETEDDKNKRDSRVNPVVGFEENESKNSIRNETENFHSNFGENGEKKNAGENGRGKRRKGKGDDIETKYEVKMYGFEKDVEKEEDPCAVGGKRKKEKEEEDALRMKEDKVFDIESKVARTIFVGNLPLKVKKKAIIREFKKFGQIDSVRLRSVPITDLKLPRNVAIMRKKINENADSVHAYVVYKTDEAAHSALSHNMALFDGHHIRVDRASTPSNKTKSEKPSHYDIKRTVFIGNLPMDVKDEEIYELFLNIKSLESNVEAVRVVRDSEMGLGKGVAFVLFKTREAAGSVIRLSLKIRNRELRLFRAKQNASHANTTGPSSAPADRSHFKSPKGSRVAKEFRPKTKAQLSGKRPSVAARKERMRAQKNRDLRRQLQGTKGPKSDHRASHSYQGEKARKGPKKAAKL